MVTRSQEVHTTPPKLPAMILDSRSGTRPWSRRVQSIQDTSLLLRRCTVGCVLVTPACHLGAGSSQFLILHVHSSLSTVGNQENKIGYPQQKGPQLEFRVRTCGEFAGKQAYNGCMKAKKHMNVQKRESSAEQARPRQGSCANRGIGRSFALLKGGAVATGR